MIYEKNMTQFTFLSFLVTLDFSVASCQSKISKYLPLKIKTVPQNEEEQRENKPGLAHIQQQLGFCSDFRVVPNLFKENISFFESLKDWLPAFGKKNKIWLNKLENCRET